MILNSVVSEVRDDLGCSAPRQRIDAWSDRLTYALVTVDAITGASLIGGLTTSINHCVIDVEGAAYEVLTDFGGQITNQHTLLIECEHSTIFRGQHLYDEVASLLRHRGFRQMAFRYSYWDQSDTVWIQERLIKQTPASAQS